MGTLITAKTTLTAALKSVLEKESGTALVTNNHEVKDVMRSEWLLKNESEDVYLYNNARSFLNEKQPPSKSRLKKCEKGLHEYSKNSIYEWSCIHCEKPMYK